MIWEILSRPFLLLWASFIGVLIGVLPAIGGSAANMHGLRPGEEVLEASRAVRHRARPEGIIASEASNNANVGGSLVTIMAFGIPGDAVTAVMLGALTIHGIQSGPLFISQNAQLAYGMFAAYLLAHPIMVVDPAGRRALDAAHRRRCPKAVLFPVVLVLCVIGAYALNNTMANVYVLPRSACSATLMVKFGFPLAPFILGVILGDQIEINLIRAIMTDPNPWLFLTRPISGVLLALSVASVVAALWQHRRHQRRAAALRRGGGRFLSCGPRSSSARARRSQPARCSRSRPSETALEDGDVRVRRAQRVEPRAQARRRPAIPKDERAAEPASRRPSRSSDRRHHADARRRAQQVPGRRAPPARRDEASSSPQEAALDRDDFAARSRAASAGRRARASTTAGARPARASRTASAARAAAARRRRRGPCRSRRSSTAGRRPATSTRLLRLPFRNAFSLLDGFDDERARRPSACEELYAAQLAAIGVVDEDAPRAANDEPLRPAPYNLLVTRRWMLRVPRSRERFGTISINALGFAGSLFVRDEEEMQDLRDGRADARAAGGERYVSPCLCARRENSVTGRSVGGCGESRTCDSQSQAPAAAATRDVAGGLQIDRRD